MYGQAAIFGYGMVGVPGSGEVALEPFPFQFGMTRIWSSPAATGPDNAGNTMTPDGRTRVLEPDIVGVSFADEDGKRLSGGAQSITSSTCARPTEAELRTGLPIRDPPKMGLFRPELGRRILQRVQRLSREFGTEMAIEGNRGVIRVMR